MKFYERIAENYNHIFPFNKSQAEFILDGDSETDGKNILEIGCGTGQLIFGLSEFYKTSTGIDLDSEMIRYAIRKYNHRENLKFDEMDMLDVDNLVDDYDTVICFGNTMVHLENEIEITDFIKKTFKKIVAGGRFMIQIINYDRILDQNIDFLPTIENEHIKFIRNYKLNNDDKIEFHTVLNIKETNKEIENRITLYPISSVALVQILKNEGFVDIKLYDNWKRKDFDSVRSIPLIIDCVKPLV
jgi:cyclopropane fatty-acyl-phospholipid synthase-like methyltransferase